MSVKQVVTQLRAVSATTRRHPRFFISRVGSTHMYKWLFDPSYTSILNSPQVEAQEVFRITSSPQCNLSQATYLAIHIAILMKQVVTQLRSHSTFEETESLRFYGDNFGSLTLENIQVSSLSFRYGNRWQQLENKYLNILDYNFYMVFLLLIIIMIVSQLKWTRGEDETVEYIPRSQAGSTDNIAQWSDSNLHKGMRKTDWSKVVMQATATAV